MEHYISNEVLLLEQLTAIIEGDTQLKLSEEAVINIRNLSPLFSVIISKKTPKL